MQSLDLGRVLVDFGEALVFIVCAFGERATTSAFYSRDELGREGAGTCIVEPRETECF
ncbi:unnamed protein product [Penicillium manginii]